jgi:hypothetical protein
MGRSFGSDGKSFSSDGKSFSSDGKMASVGKAAHLEALDSEDRVVLVFEQGFRR